MGMFDYQDEIHPNYEEDENEWKNEGGNGEASDGCLVLSYDGFNYSLTRKQQECLDERLYHVSHCLDEAWEECTSIIEHEKVKNTSVDERYWQSTQHDDYIQSIYCYFKWTRNNLADIDVKKYYNPDQMQKYDEEHCVKCMQMCEEIKEQIKTLCGLIPAVEATGSPWDLTKPLFALWKAADDVLTELCSLLDDFWWFDDVA